MEAIDKMYDKKRCIENIYAIAKEKNIKIGDMEEKAGVSKGYLSRINKENNTTSPSIEVLASIAETLSVTVDMLMNGDFASMNANEKFVFDFLGKLNSETEKGYVQWEKETPKELKRVKYYDGQPDHPLLKHAIYSEIGMSGYPEEVSSGPEFASQFINEDYPVKLLGNLYHLNLRGATVYIAHISYADEEGYDYEQYEVYVLQGNRITPLCSDDIDVSKELRMQIIGLYTNVDNLNCNVGLNTQLKSWMYDYIHQDDDLPFN